MSLSQRARAAAETRARERATASPRPPSEFQCTAAYELSRITGVEIDSRSVEGGEYDDAKRHYVGYATVDGHRFRFEALWDGRDWRYGTNWTFVEVRGRLGRRKWVEVRNLADLGEALA